MSRLLLIEDNEMNRDMLARRLTRAGHEVVTAVNGVNGVEAALQSKPDLILMDLRLPDMDGRQVTKLLKADPKTLHIPVLALTAYAMEGDRERAMESGCDDYDTKPVELPRLLKKIAALIQRRGIRNAVETQGERPSR